MPSDIDYFQFVPLRSYILTALTLFLVPAILFGLHQYNRLAAPLRLSYRVFLALTILAFSGYMLMTMAENITNVTETDFVSFWLNGRVGASGLNFYDAENYRALSASMNLPDYFLERLIDTAFWYPPVTILLFIPLGLFEIQAAWVLWNIVLILTFVVNIWLLHKLFLPRTGLIGIGAITALLLVLYPNLVVFEHGQTNFLLLLLLLLLWQDREKPRAGAWLALAIVIKPLVGPLLLCFVLWRQWRALLNVILTLAALLLAVIAFSGAETFFSYDPLSKLPLSVYTEPINQGLLATMLRLTGYQFTGKAPVTHPLFLGGALALTLATAWLVFRLPRQHRGWGLLLTLSLATLVYPTSLQHYGTFAVLPLLALWQDAGGFPGGVRGKIVFLTLVYVCFSYQLGYHSFIPYALLWIMLAGKAITTLSAAGVALSPAQETTPNLQEQLP